MRRFDSLLGILSLKSGTAKNPVKEMNHMIHVRSTSQQLGCIRVSRNLEKNLPEAPQAPKFFDICHSTAPLASQAPEVHMYRIIIERYMYGPRSLGGHFRDISDRLPDLKLSRHLRNFGPAPHSPAAPRAACRARSRRGPPSSRQPPPHPRWLDTLARLLTSEIHVR